MKTRQKKSKNQKSLKTDAPPVKKARSSSGTLPTQYLDAVQVVPLSRGKRKKAKKSFHLLHWLKQKLRRISYQYPARKEAITKARIGRGLYKCAKCEGIFKHGEFNLDHINPVDDPHTGFTTWDNYVSRLFVDVDGWQILCTQCHNTKTAYEQEIRKQIKQEKKKEDEDTDI